MRCLKKCFATILYRSFRLGKSRWRHLSTFKCLCCNRSSRLHMLFKLGVLKNFVIFIGKQLCWILFLIKLRTWRAATLLKRDSIIRVSCEYCEIFKSSFLIEHLWAAFSVVNFEHIKRRIQNLVKHLKWSFMKIAVSG